MSGKRLNLRFLSSLLAASLLFAACSREESEFPDLEIETDASSVESTDETSPEDDTDSIKELTVALPLSEDTVNRLMKLYYAKCNGLFPDAKTGADISIEYLDAINTSWVVDTVTTTWEGASVEYIEDLAEDDISPDIFLCSDMLAAYGAGLTVPFDSYLYDSSDIYLSDIYYGALECMITDGQYLGLPFYSTVFELCGSSEFVPESGTPAFNITGEQFVDYLGDISEQYSVTPFYDAVSLRIFYGNNSLVDTLIEDGLSADEDEFGADPRMSRSCGMWLISSGEYSMWSSYYSDYIYFTMLPDVQVQAEVYPVCLSSSSQNPEFAAGFASFLCFDSDCRMLMYRLEPQRGFFPVIASSGVWDELTADSEFGSQAVLYEQFMSSAEYAAAGTIYG